MFNNRRRFLDGGERGLEFRGKENGSFPRRVSVHNSRLVQYRLSRLRSTGQAKGKGGSMKDSFRAGNLVCTAWKEKSEKRSGLARKNFLLHFSIKSSLFLSHVSHLDISSYRDTKNVRQKGN